MMTRTSELRRRVTNQVCGVRLEWVGEKKGARRRLYGHKRARGMEKGEREP
jgi:hypothetical protein